MMVYANLPLILEPAPMIYETDVLLGEFFKFCSACMCIYVYMCM